MTEHFNFPLFEAKGISYTYPVSPLSLHHVHGKPEILHQLSFSLKEGSCTALLGNNGSGKSTLLSILAGARKPEEGLLYLNGARLGSSSCPFSRSIGYVPQENPLIEELNARDNLLLRFGGSRKDFDKTLSAFYFQMLDIDSLLRLPVRKMSGGMKRRLSLACAFLNEPKLLLLDEPCSALDISMKKKMHACLSSYLKNGGTILLSTHEQEDLSLCDSLLLLKDKTLTSLPPSLRGEALQSYFD